MISRDLDTDCNVLIYTGDNVVNHSLWNKNHLLQEWIISTFTPLGGIFLSVTVFLG